MQEKSNIVDFLYTNQNIIRFAQQTCNPQQYYDQLQKQLFPTLIDLKPCKIQDQNFNLSSKLQDMLNTLENVEIQQEMQFTQTDDIDQLALCLTTLNQQLEKLNNSKELTSQIISLKNIDYVNSKLYKLCKKLSNKLGDLKKLTDKLHQQNSVSCCLEQLNIQPLATIL